MAHEAPQFVEQILVADGRRHGDAVALAFADGSQGVVAPYACGPGTTRVGVELDPVLLPQHVALEDEGIECVLRFA